MEQLKEIDISRPIMESLAVWPGAHNKINIDKAKSFDLGGDCNVSRISLGMHTGTHLDAPSHFIIDGKSVDKYPLSRFRGRCLVIDCTGITGLIEPDDISPRLEESDVEIVVFKTGSVPVNSTVFDEGFTSISLSSAEFLKEQNITMVGIDTYSIESYHSENHEVHKSLLGGDVLVLENLMLDNIVSGEYYLQALPIKFIGTEAAPCRAVLYKENI